MRSPQRTQSDACPRYGVRRRFRFRFRLRLCSSGISGLRQLMAVVAEERDGIATEPPVDVEERTARFARTSDASLVAEADGQIVGVLGVEVSRFGFGYLGMFVDSRWRGRGVGSALVQAAIERARGQRVHKLCLEVA